jgi:hypothetical protein
MTAAKEKKKKKKKILFWTTFPPLKEEEEGARSFGYGFEQHTHTHSGDNICNLSLSLSLLPGSNGTFQRACKNGWRIDEEEDAGHKSCWRRADLSSSLAECLVNGWPRRVLPNCYRPLFFLISLFLSLSLKEFVGCLTRVDTQEEEEERSNMRIK